MANIDERLLSGDTLRSEEEGDAARELKQRKRAEAGDEANGEAGSGGSLRQRIRQARQALDLKERAKKKIEEKVAAPVRAVTNRALQWAWKALIPSWGLSSIWINIHVFLKSVFGEKLFCKLGEEWIPKQATEAAGEVSKVVNKSLGLVEVMTLIFIDIIIFFIIVGFFAMFTDEGTFRTVTGESAKNQQAPAVQSAK